VELTVICQPLNRGNISIGSISSFDLTASNRQTIDMNRAGSALTNAAPILGSGQTDHISQCPQERHIIWHFNFKRLSIYL
jgi:hypothetical protein